MSIFPSFFVPIVHAHPTVYSYEARRVILKQGHRPEAFYILLAGSVIANIRDTHPETGRQFVKTVKEAGPGETFGVRSYFYCEGLIPIL